MKSKGVTIGREIDRLTVPQLLAICTAANHAQMQFDADVRTSPAKAVEDVETVMRRALHETFGTAKPVKRRKAPERTIMPEKDQSWLTEKDEDTPAFMEAGHAET